MLLCFPEIIYNILSPTASAGRRLDACVKRYILVSETNRAARRGQIEYRVGVSIHIAVAKNHLKASKGSRGAFYAPALFVF